MDILKALLMGKRRKAGVQKQVEQRFAAGLCLRAKCPNSNNGSRGLCIKHYTIFSRSILNRPLEEKLGIELEAIRKGELLESNEVRKLKAEQAEAVAS